MGGRSILTLILVCISFCFSYGQYGYNDIIKKQLDSIYTNDQAYRRVIAMQPSNERDSIANVVGISSEEVNGHFAQLQHKLDSIDVVKVELIFQKFGYPGKSLVGQPANETAYYVIQHSDKIKKYFPLIEKAGKKGEISFRLVAMMQDRLLKEEGKEQVYGTQYAGTPIKDSETHQTRIYWFLWPVKDFAHVNERRKKAGFKDTVAENAAAQGIELNVITLAYAKKNYPMFFPKK